MPIYHQVALNIPLFKLMTYRHDKVLPIGTRVIVPFRGKPKVAFIWESQIKPDIDEEKILPITTVFDNEPRLNKDWIELLEFTSRYYHYPLGASIFTAIPAGMKKSKQLSYPIVDKTFILNKTGLEQKAPSQHHHKLLALWNALALGIKLSAAKNIHARAIHYLNQWQELGYLDEISNHTINVKEGAVKLNEQQFLAYKTICDSLNSFKSFLLFGITGSGKTETYFEVMAEVFSQGKSVLFLLPEINLTEQLLARFAKRFPDISCALLHSRNSDGERTQDYLSALCGQVQLVIGTRLAVFTPIKNLGLIVVDEEHDSSFKQDNELRYHARDLAIWRAKQAQCPIILGSATPSLESFYAAQNKRYQLLSITRRAKENARLPEILIDNVRHQKLTEGLSQRTFKLLQQNLKNGGLSLVYLNRRGFAPALFCSDCGYSFSCPNCSAKMVLHRTAHHLRCHHCNHQIPIPAYCPDCGNVDLSAIGFGTQRIEDALKKIFPTARIARVDRDSMSHKNDWQEICNLILERKLDIIVGTQILAKGHDFDQLNLVTVLNADGSLYSADLRARERLFAELMQVSGRAGRDKSAGKVLIQTQLPDNPIFHDLKRQDYISFAQSELNLRHSFRAPPYVYIAACRADAPQLDDAMQFLRDTLQQLRLPENIYTYGPAPQLMVRLSGRERAQIFIESTNRALLHNTINTIANVMQKLAKKRSKIHHIIDIDPIEC